MSMTKKCFMCSGTDNISDKPNATYKGKMWWLCRPCKSQRMKIYYEAKRDLVFRHYGDICNCCKETNKLFLSIDHINNNGNEEVWQSGTRITGVQLYQRIVKANYPTTYQLLCMNCNFGKRMNNGACPHMVQL